MTARVEFISLELQDVGPFGGRQFFSFARPRAGWGPGLTVVTGGGGSGKSSLAAALQLAIWGTSWPDASGRDYHSRWLAADWRRCINAQALRHRDPTALLRLTLRTSAAEGAEARTIISRSISVRDDQSVVDSVRVEVAERGEQPRETPGDHMRVIEELLPLDCLGLMFCKGDRLEDLGGLEVPPAARSSYGYGDEPTREAEPTPPERVTRVRCEDEWIEFCLTEHVRRIRDAGPPAPDGSRSRWETAYDYEPTGKLALGLTNVTAPGVRTKWQETKKQRLEEMLAEFVAYLPTVALSFKLEREEEKRRRTQ